MTMPLVTTADTKRRLVEAVTKIVNEVAIVTEEDLAEVKQKIEEESHDILVSDLHTYHTLDVMVTIFPRETLYGQVEISVAAILWQRLINNQRIVLEKTPREKNTFTSNVGHTPCRYYKFVIRQVMLATLVRLVAELIAIFSRYPAY